jgi:hypothetical protein
MRKFMPLSLVLMLLASSLPAGVLAAAPQGEQQPGKIVGTARGTSGQPLPNVSARVRSLLNGEVVDTVASGPTGEFMFAELAPGRYVVEVVDGGKIVGMTSSIGLEAGMTLSVDVLAVLPGALAASTGAGFSLFGLGPTVTTSVLGAAAAVAIAGVVSTRPEASPSR